jgi:hypothetical protein
LRYIFVGGSMPNDDLKAFGVEIPVGADDTQTMSLDADVRGFTGLLVGLAIGVASWGLILAVWWLV